MLQKKLVSGLFWVLLLNLIVKPFWILGIEVGVQNAVGAEAYGFYFAIFNLTYIFNILLDVGITNYNTRNIAQHPQLIEKHLSGILSLKLLLLGLYVLVTFSVALLMGYNSAQFHLLAILTFNQFLNSLILYLRSNFEGLLLFQWDSVISVLDRLLMIVICGFMLWAPAPFSILNSQFSILHFAYAQTAAYLATVLLALVLLIRRTGLRRLRFNRLFSLAVLKQSLPFALLVLLMASYNRIDPLLLQQLLPASVADIEVGVYASAFRLLDGLTMIAYLVSVPLLPVFAKLVNNSHQELNDTTHWVFSLMMVFAIAAAVTLSSMADPLMSLLYNEHEVASASVFRILIYGIVPIGTTYVFGTLLTAAGRLKELNLLACGALLSGVVVNLLLIPRYGALGAACASLTAQGLMAVAQVIVAVRLFHLRIMPSYILKMALFTLWIIMVNWLLPPMQWWWALLAATAATFAAALPLGLLDIRHLKRLKIEK